MLDKSQKIRHRNFSPYAQCCITGPSYDPLPNYLRVTEPGFHGGGGGTNLQRWGANL